MSEQQPQTSHAPIRKVMVLGAGTMGAQIAAHLANAGAEVLLLDMPAKEGARNAIAEKGIAIAAKSNPAAFFDATLASRITPGNFEDDLPKAKGVDWVIEAIVENLDIKRSLFAKLEGHLKPGTIVSSNTSGISIAALAEGRNEIFRKGFLGTHFFNPPRYMHLLEVIGGKETDPVLRARIEHYCDVALGKGLVSAKDTPNFIANRIGIFGAMRALQSFREEGLSFGAVDKVTGSLVGRPKSATFRTFDLVGLDVVLHVARNVYDNAPADERRNVFVAPDYVERMAREKMLGDKTGGGFYKKVKGEDGKSQILALDLDTFEYVPQAKVKIPALDMVSQMEGLKDRLKALVFGKDNVGSFLRKTLLETLVYAAARVPEVSDSIADVDRAMVWGFGWKKGPFSTWDMLGVEKTLPLVEELGLAVPPLVKEMLAKGQKSFYEEGDGVTRYYDLGKGLVPDPDRPGVTVLKSVKARTGVIKKNSGASLVDLGDGVLCVEFHSKMNAIGADTIGMLGAGLAELESRFDAMVVANDGSNFSVGANIMLLMLEAQEGNFDDIDLMVRQFQKANMALKTAAKPVVVAPFGMTLGGGLEVTLHGGAVQASAESYMGLVEVGVGLIPAGGGTKELLLRQLELVPKGGDPFPAVRAAFEAIGMAKVGKSILEDKALGFLRDGDGITMNRDRLTADAKSLALSLARRGYQPKKPATNVPALGANGLAAIKVALDHMKRGGFISEYDHHIGVRLGRIITGGDLAHRTEVTEQRLLDLEREAFLSLCGERKTLERIQAMLKTGKPLRN